MGTRGTGGAWVAALWLWGAASGCDPQTPTDDDHALRAARAVGHGSQSMDGTPRMAAIGALFEVDPALDPTDPDALRQGAVQAVHDRLALTFQVVGCDAQLDTDGDRVVHVAFEGCRLMLWTFDVDIDAEARVETEACDDGTCVTGVLWALDIAELSSSTLGLARSGMSGPAELRAPVDHAEPMRWETFPGFVLETRLGLRLEAVSTSTWALADDDCVTIDFGGRLSLETRIDEIDEAIGDVVVSARGIHRCPGRCEDAGDVQLAFGTGQVVEWSHDGSDTITVFAPRERTFEVVLPCADDAEGADAG